MVSISSQIIGNILAINDLIKICHKNYAINKKSLWDNEILKAQHHAGLFTLAVSLIDIMHIITWDLRKTQWVFLRSQGIVFSHRSSWLDL